MAKDEIIHSDSVRTVTLPKDMEVKTAMKILRRRLEWLEERTTLHISKARFPLEVALAISEVYEDRYGTAPATRHKVKIETSRGKVSVPWGEIELPDAIGYLDMDIDMDRDAGHPVFSAHVRTVNKDVHKWEAFIREVEARLESHGYIRGRSWRITENCLNSAEGPKRLRIGRMAKADLILPEQIQALVNASIFTPIEKADACREAGIPLKRGNLLAGPYGTGKTLTAKLTAKLAEKNGWTFFLVEDVDALIPTIRMARNYSPAVVFMEDADEVLKPHRDEQINDLLNTIDGIDGKDSEVMLVLTTNHVESINPAALRPGRFDAVIMFSPPDADAALRIVKRYMGNDWYKAQDPALLSSLGNVAAGTIPAFIREACERARLHAIASRHDEVTASDIEAAMHGIKLQKQLASVGRREAPSDLIKAAAVLGSAIRGAEFKVEQVIETVADVGKPQINANGKSA